MVHLTAYDWDVHFFGPVYLKVGLTKVRMSYIGFSNVQGDLVLILTPDDARYPTVESTITVADTDSVGRVEVHRTHD